MPDVSATVFDPVGDADNAGTVGNVVDGDPSTVWTTSRYFQPFPALKPGIGVLASFDAAEPLTGLTIDSPTAGAVVQVRSAPSAEPTLAETTLLDTVTLSSGRTTVGLDPGRPTQHVLLWITNLGPDNQTRIDDIGFRRTAP
ncbi:hypothetical protein WY02_16325 [Pseudonocardia sp. AL041005-10]|nr:hypothetical protein WY02_16325 [Pseudonocardia sp. AL041005-10]